MTRFLFSTGLAALLSCHPATAVELPAAVKILNGWHHENARPGERLLHFVLWMPSDREPTKEYQNRLTRIMEDIRGFYGREMKRHGFGERTIRLPYDDQGKMVIHLSKGKHPTSHYEMESGQEVRRDCLETLSEAGINGQKETVVMFCHLADWDEKAFKFTHKSPYYAGGNQQSGNAWQLDSPELDTLNLKAKEPMIHDGQYGHISLGKHNSIFIGGIAHELGHALGLPHCKERTDEAVRGNALMGSGNRSYGDDLREEGKGSFLTLAHALRLASHPMFSGSTKGMNSPVKSDLSDLEITVEGKSIAVKGRVEASPPVYAVIAYFDPEGGSDYDARTASAIPDKDGNFALKCADLPAGKAGELRIVPLHVNGATAGWLSQSPFAYPYKILADGTIDLTTLTVKKELAKVIDALDRRQSAEAEEEARALDGMAGRIAANLFGTETSIPPSEDTASESASLTSFEAESAKVGWSRPTFNALPGTPYLLEAGGDVYERGIYAHAPASHQYDLSGKWSQLEGSAAMAAGKGGTVQFEIRGDGEVLWRSKTIRDGQLVKFSADVKGVKTIILNVHPTNDGTGSDWGLWLEPILKR